MSQVDVNSLLKVVLIFPFIPANLATLVGLLAAAVEPLVVNNLLCVFNIVDAQFAFNSCQLDSKELRGWLARLLKCFGGHSSGADQETYNSTSNVDKRNKGIDNKPDHTTQEVEPRCC